MKTKRITCVIICLIMVFALLPTAAFAAEPATGVWVGGTDVSAGGCWLNDGAGGITTGTADNYNVRYDAGSKTLTLKGANITKSSCTYYAAIGTNSLPGTAAVYAGGPLTITLEGENNVTKEELSSELVSAGIYAAGDLTVNGGGKLTATCGTASYLSYGVYGSSVAISGGTVIATGRTASGISCGVFGNSVTMSNSTVTANGGTAASGSSCGVYSGNSVTISDSTVTANGGEAGGISGGVYSGSVTISNSTVTATGGEATSGSSYGIYGNTKVDISSGDVEATGGKAAAISCGICCNAQSVNRNVTITNSTVTAIGGEVTANRNAPNIASYGISCSVPSSDIPIEDHTDVSNITITGGTVTAAGGTVTATGVEKSSSSSFGICCSDYLSAGNITIKGGEVIATGGTASAGAASVGNYGLSCGMNGITVTIEEGSEVTAAGGTVTANGGAEAFGQSYGVFGGGSTTISGGTVTAVGGTVTVSGGTENTSMSYGVRGYNSAAISGGTVTATGGEAAGGFSFGVHGGSSTTISGGTVTAVGRTCACRVNLSLSGYPAKRYITTSGNISGLPVNRQNGSGDINSSELGNCKYLRVAPCAADIGTVTVGGTTGTAITEAEAAITLLDAEFSGLNADKDVSTWFTNLPAGLSAKIKTVNAEKTSATITLSGMPTAAGTAVMTVTIPAANLVGNADLTVTLNADAKWNIAAAYSGYIYTGPTASVYNDPAAPNATVWLSGSGLDSSDLLVTESNPTGSEYKALLKLADSDDVFATYNIHLKSGKKSSDAAMNLTFKAGAGYAGQDFTLVHQKADGTYEYFHDTADAGGDLSFGPLYELSPFMLVRGTLAQATTSDVKIPATGESTRALPWLASALMIAAVSFAVTALCRRERY